ncbi:unnamed protein product [Adineta steineri]|uniref:N-acetyltransferase domain-containing protein n=1 Tax=Adineta steineri TaxID=433720 RepID=A0A814QR02_9BILA|nr:unnamed protein product [Adineta steineri]CAF1123456.1 unnamed protein product [Adineta steineri]
MSVTASKESIQHVSTAQSCPSLTYRIATLSDCESIVSLVNSSTRGDSSRQGWTSAESLLEGQRVDAGMLTEIINSNHEVVFIFFDENSKILVGCVHLKHDQTNKCAFLGMLAVRPDLQTQGFGKFIISTAENYALNNWNVEYIEMSTITLRTELIAFYHRRGYIDTGRREPFPAEHGKYGVPKQNGLELCFLRKPIKQFENKSSE